MPSSEWESGDLGSCLWSASKNQCDFGLKSVSPEETIICEFITLRMQDGRALPVFTCPNPPTAFSPGTFNSLILAHEPRLLPLHPQAPPRPAHLAPPPPGPHPPRAAATEAAKWTLEALRSQSQVLPPPPHSWGRRWISGCPGTGRICSKPLAWQGLGQRQPRRHHVAFGATSRCRET